MTAAEKREIAEVTNKLTEFEEAAIESVAAIDQCDGSRISLQGTLDTVRENLANAYGESFEDALNEHLGIEGEIDDEEDDQDDEEDDQDDEV